MATAKKASAAKSAAKTDAQAPAKSATPMKKTAAAPGKAAADTAPVAGKKAAAKRAPNAAFLKPLTPSPALAALIGDKPMPRTEVTKKIWEYIKKHDLQDAQKRTVINADSKLKEVVKAPQVTMFELTKLVNAHLS